MKNKNLLAIITFLFVTILMLCLFSCGTEQYTVTFDADGGSAVEAQIVEEGKNAVKPQAPTKEGYNFAGWFNGDTEYKFDSIVGGDIALKAKWEKKAYTVTFDANGGNGSTEKTVTHGGTVTAPMATKPKHSLIGWFNGDTQWNFKTDTVTEDITLVAKWEAFN
ncbi:MAG: InlB B-repeat-containing protein [Clostridia bacterium]|nr:InlB B-repeat-containing protein [Clostridia bacterium]